MIIERDIIKQLEDWKVSENRKPILLLGARQIGKTWVMENLGKKSFSNYLKINFDRQENIKEIFRRNKDPKVIIKELELQWNKKIIPGKTLLIFDEIQECEEAFNSLKYFHEEAPEYHIIAAGSLLGVAVRRRRMTVPVGQVKLMRMFPISFGEFLRASDNDAYQKIENIEEPQHLPEAFLDRVILEYKRYMICGGMPEAVVACLRGAGYDEVDDILQQILDLYELDFAKYAEPREIPRIKAIWHSLPSQLSKENRKFIYKAVRTGARSKDYEDALLWLEDAGMIYRIMNISKPAFPLSAYADIEAFKIYACDCGLLRQLAKLPASIISNPIANYTEFKGAIAENTVLQSLMTTSRSGIPYYWSSGNKAEVEFVIQNNDEIIPVEVKAESRISGKSLSVYAEKYKPNFRIRFTFQNLQMNGGLLSCPSPLADWFRKWLW